MTRWRGVLAALCALTWQAVPIAAAVAVDVSVVDGDGRPAAGVRLNLKSGERTVATAETDAAGRARFPDVAPGVYEISASKDGFEPLRKSGVNLSPDAAASIELTLVPSLARKESIEVSGQAAPVEEGGSTPESISGQAARQLPSRPATVADALPMIPGVARQPGGGLQISGAAEHRSALIVNSADVTDPATGQFGLTVPIDSVQTLSVFQTPFLAEYGRFSAGLVSVETRRGGESWKWEINDPLPEFFIRSWHLRGLRDATPRLNFEGPLIHGKLYLSEGFEYEVRKTPVFTLPFPYNLKRKTGFNSFAQLDWVISGKHLATGTVHIAPQRLGNVGINYFNPPGTSPDASTHNYTGTLADRITTPGGGLIENTISVTRFDAGVWAKGPAGLTLAPTIDTGNYFASQNREAGRAAWLPAYSFAPVKILGLHNFKTGGYAAASTDDGLVSANPIEVRDAAGNLLERYVFTPGQPFRMHDTELAFFGQDHWLVTPHLSLDFGVRTESQAISGSFRVAPRGGFAWSPLASLGTVFRGGFGLFYDRVPLNVYSFDHYPNAILTRYGPGGAVSGGPYFYVNGLGEVTNSRRFVFLEPEPGNFAPRSTTWSFQIEQPLARFLKLRAGYMSTLSDGLVVMDSSVPDPATNTAARLLSGSGQARYRQLELTARLRLADDRELMFSYIHSRARGDLNDFNNFLGSFPVPIVHPNQFADLPTDLPNRILAWGAFRLPWTLRISPVIEYRNGFPYVVTNALQRYVGVPNSQRFPNFLSVDSRFSKDIRLNPKYAVRFSVSGFNLTAHQNPEAVHWNTADPAYGMFFGQRGRHFTVDFDVLF